MQTEFQTNKKRDSKIAAKNTTVLTKSSVGMRNIDKLIDEQAEGDEGDANGQGRHRRKRRKRRGRGGAEARKSTATRISTPVIATDYMTTREAAAYVKLSRQFLEGARYRGDGSGPPYIKLERAVRYRRSALDAWMAAHDHSPDKPIYAE